MMGSPRMKSGGPSAFHRPAAFTLVELLVAIAILTIMLGVTFSLMGRVSDLWTSSSRKINSFQAARLGFDIMTRNLSQATLNTYLGYDNETNPRAYLRKSDLRFVLGRAGADGFPGTAGTGAAVFFQAPVGYISNQGQFGGMDTLLNTIGYYVSFVDAAKPGFVANATPYRYRLMQMLVPTENNTIYPDATVNTWFSANAGAAVQIADNVIALVIRPQDPDASPPDITSGSCSYDTYDPADANPGPTYAQSATSQQLPPILQITMIALDEASALRLENGSAEPSQITGALAGKFTDPAQYDSDLKTLKDTLDHAGIRYRIFSGAVALLESKWTK